MNVLQFLGIYPDAIENASEIAESAVETCGATVSEVNDMHSDIQEKFFKNELNNEDLTNSIICEYFNYAKEFILKKIPSVDIDVCVNCDASYFLINGENYNAGDYFLQELYDRYNNIEITETDGKYYLTVNDDESLYNLISEAYSLQTGEYYPDIYEDYDLVSMSLDIEGDEIKILINKDGDKFVVTDVPETKEIFEIIKKKIQYNEIIKEQ